MEERVNPSQADQIGHPGDPAETWEYQVFSERLYGRVNCRVDGWPPSTALPREIARFVDLGVKRLVARVGRDGWMPAETIGALDLWRQGRVSHTLHSLKVGIAEDRCDISFHRVQVRCRRPVQRQLGQE